MNDHRESQPTPQPLRPQPVPMEIDVEGIATSGGNMVLVRIRTYSGQHVFFFVPDEARGLASIIAKTAAMAASGLIIPNGVIPRAQDPEEN